MLTLRVLSFLVVLAIHSANKLLHVCKKRVFLIISLSRIMYHILTTGFIKAACMEENFHIYFENIDDSRVYYLEYATIWNRQIRFYTFLSPLVALCLLQLRTCKRGSELEWEIGSREAVVECTALHCCYITGWWLDAAHWLDQLGWG